MSRAMKEEQETGGRSMISDAGKRESPAHELRNEINFDQALDFWNQNGKIECIFLCKYSRLKEE